MTELSQTWPCFSLGSTHTPKHAMNWPKVCTSWHMHMHTRSSALLKFWWEGGKKGCRVLSSQVGQAEKRPQHEVKKKRMTWKKERRQQIFAFFNSMFRWVDNHKHYASVNAEHSLKKYKPCHCQVKEKKIFENMVWKCIHIKFGEREALLWKWFPDQGKHLRGKGVVKRELDIQFVTYSRCRESFLSVSDMIILVWYAVTVCDCSACLQSLPSVAQFRLKANEMHFITKETVGTLMEHAQFNKGPFNCKSKII